MAQITLETIADFAPEGFEQVLETFPHLVSKAGAHFRSPRTLKSGCWMEAHLGAKSLYRLASQSAELAGFTEEWRVEYKAY